MKEFVRDAPFFSQDQIINEIDRKKKAAVRKIVVRDITEAGYEPYDRQYILGEVAGYCQRNPSILRNAGMTTVLGRGYLERESVWENHSKPVHYVCFELDELTDAKWEFLQSSIGSWAVRLDVLPDDTEVTVHYPSEFA